MNNVVSNIIKAAPNLKAPSSRVSRSYPSFISDVENHKIAKGIYNTKTGIMEYIDTDGNTGSNMILPIEKTWNTLVDSNLDFEIVSQDPIHFDAGGLFYYIFFVLFLASLVNNFMGGGGGAGGRGPVGMGAKKIEIEKDIKTRFADVEGIDDAKEEIEEIVDFLKNPHKYEGSGARVPKGALLIGEPGCGKTLLARAIAGESNVPFIQCSASSFVEMFVGVGARRVRDIFEFAKKNQPCIVFIDELDSVGRRRETGSNPSNEEREQTINQLLTEMDGFDDSSKVIVIAATNREDILDDALIRPGRFDRKIEVKAPNADGRERILMVHSMDKNLSPDLSLREVAKQTVGFSGAELANLMNESAIKAVQYYDGIITNQVIDECFERIVVGSVNKNIKISHEKRTLVAYHEAGHALVGALMPNYDILKKISIVSRGNTGGVTYFVPRDDDVDGGLYSKNYLTSRIKVAMGGIAAEEVIYGGDNVTTGAYGDIETAKQIANQMVESGLGNTLIISSQEDIDAEVEMIINTCFLEVISLIRDNQDILELIKNELLVHDIVEGDFVYDRI